MCPEIIRDIPVWTDRHAALEGVSCPTPDTVETKGKIPCPRVKTRRLRGLLRKPFFDQGKQCCHSWLFHTSLAMHVERWPEDLQYEVLEKFCDEYSRYVPCREIWDAIQNAAPGDSGGRSGSRRKDFKPSRESSHALQIREDLLEQIPSMKVSDLVSRSNPIPACRNNVLATLYHPGTLICIGRSSHMGDHRTRPLEQIIKRNYIESFDLIVPNPMSKLIGLTRDGRPSPRTLDNAGPPVYAVYESDQYEGDLDIQASIILWLAERLPLKMVVHSGGKSLHAWFDVHGSTEEQWDNLYRIFAELDGDNALACRHQYCRMPGGVRRDDRGNYQQILFLAEEANILKYE